MEEEQELKKEACDENEPREEETQVIYLNVPESDEPQVLDLSNLLVQEGIQIVETSEVDHVTEEALQVGAHNIVLENNSENDITVVADEPEALSAQALLRLAKSQRGDVQSSGQEVIVSDILHSQRRIEEGLEHGQNASSSAEALLQLSSDQATTYILDEQGTMIPLTEVRSSDAGDTYLEVDDAGVTTIALCQCWCGKEFICQADLEKHKMTHNTRNSQRTSASQLVCEICQSCFPSQAELTNHQAEIHPDRMPWECPICQRRFSKKIGVKVHLRAHNGLKQHQCNVCNRIFSYKNALIRHIRVHNREKPFKCTICGEGFTNQWALKKHRMGHQPLRLYQCDICMKTFKQKQTLYVHSRIHTGQKPYGCDICGRCFSLKSSLEQHKRIHTGEKPKVCPICQRSFRQASTLSSHMKIHSYNKPYKCRYCKVRFAYQDEVLEHEHTHVQDKAWQCDECGMRFKNQSLLCRHIRKHTNERPFQCNICFKQFGQSGSLQGHMRSHTKEKPYECRICSKAYCTSGTLLIHIRRAHNIHVKKVKDIFPKISHIEDQRVFTIPCRNQMEDTEKMPEEALKVEEVLAEHKGELDRDAGDSTDPSQYVTLEVTGVDLEKNAEGCEAVSVSLPGKEGLETSFQHGTRKSAASKKADVAESTTRCETDQDASTEESGRKGDTADQVHSAKDIQEAALGLAELALLRGEGHKEKQQSGTITFVKEDESSNEPNVTKIILSKEGGIMNSQDPHQCPVCSRIFGRKSIMIEHLRIHTDEKPYVCDFCSLSFRQNAQLRSHIRNRHTKEKRYQCSFCHNRFLSLSITVRHINFHHKLKMRFCQKINPAWKIEDAVWSDENFELSSRKSKFMLKEAESGRKKPAMVMVMDVDKEDPVDALNAECHDEGQQLKTDTASEEVVSQNEAGKSASMANVLASLGTTMNSSQAEAICQGSFIKLVPDNESSNKAGDEKTAQENLNHISIRIQPNQNSGGEYKWNEVIASEECVAEVDISTSEVDTKSDKNTDPKVSVITTNEQTFNKAGATVEVSHDNQQEVSVKVRSDESQNCSEETVPGIDADSQFLDESETNSWYGGSRLVCETCAMQFRGISSLRAHLRKVHNTTLAESDVSFMYEDGDPESQATVTQQYPMEGEENTDGDRVVEQSTLKSLVVGKKLNINSNFNIIVYDDKSKCSDGKVPRGDGAVPKVECPICSVPFYSKRALEEHQKSHSDQEVESVNYHRCDTCNLFMKNTQQISRHIVKCHGVKKIYTCSVCQKDFFQHSSVLRHMKFFHKWEMKIRGEGNIPVLTKAAPAAIQAPAKISHFKTSKVPEMPSGRRAEIETDGDVTYISLESTDLEKLQVFASDGREIAFDVWTKKGKTASLTTKEKSSEEQPACSGEQLKEVVKRKSEADSKNNSRELTTSDMLSVGDPVTVQRAESVSGAEYEPSAGAESAEPVSELALQENRTSAEEVNIATSPENASSTGADAETRINKAGGTDRVGCISFVEQVTKVLRPGKDQGHEDTVSSQTQRSMSTRDTSKLNQENPDSRVYKKLVYITEATAAADSAKGKSLYEIRKLSTESDFGSKSDQITVVKKEELEEEEEEEIMKRNTDERTAPSQRQREDSSKDLSAPPQHSAPKPKQKSVSSKLKASATSKLSKIKSTEMKSSGRKAQSSQTKVSKEKTQEKVKQPGKIGGTQSSLSETTGPTPDVESSKAKDCQRQAQLKEPAGKKKKEVAKKPVAVPDLPQTTRRSSSGRILKRKKFADEDD